MHKKVQTSHGKKKTFAHLLYMHGDTILQAVMLL